MKKILTLFVLFPFICLGQNQGNIWYFGNHAGIDFNGGVPVALTNGSTDFCQSHNEGSSVISDNNGALLFYTDGQTVWNRNHQVMLNGVGLLGNVSSTQSSIIVPQPLSDRYYYVFTTDAWACFGTLINGLRYSVIDICADNSFGGVLTDKKNLILLDTACEKLAVTRHSNGVDYWVLTHKFYSNKFYAFLLTTSGISDTVISSVGSVHMGNIAHSMGQLKFSNTGQKIAVGVAHGGIGVADGLEALDLLDFDKTTGAVSNSMTLYKPNSDNMSVYGVEFSPDNSKLYVHGMPVFGSISNYLFQYDLNAGGGNIDSINASVNIINNSGGNMQYYGLQIGPDNKIYKISNMDAFFLSVINNPNSYGVSCGYVETAVYLGGKTGSYSLPSVIAGYNYSNSSYNCIVGFSEQQQEIISTKIYPNPFSKQTTIQINKKLNNAEILVEDVFGRQVKQIKNISEQTIIFNQDNLTGGIYFLLLIEDGKVLASAKIIIAEKQTN